MQRDTTKEEKPSLPVPQPSKTAGGDPVPHPSMCSLSVFWPSFLCESVHDPDSEKGSGWLGDSLDLRVSASQGGDRSVSQTQKCELGRKET